MIFKSYLVEQNIDILKNNIVLFYGENIGIIEDFKEKLIFKNQNSEIIKLNQDQILKNENILFNEIQNNSLFGNSKIFFIQDVNDKFFKITEEILSILKDNKIFLFANILEKNSKLRNFFEKEKKVSIVPCYQDTQLNIKKLIYEKLKNFSGITPEVMNILIESCGNDRAKLKNEIIKIKTFFHDKKIVVKFLPQLLNINENNDFNAIKDAAINGDKVTTNNLLSNTTLDTEKLVLYLAIINQRLEKIKLLKTFNEMSVEDAIVKIKPPIFWKDKPILLQQTKSWTEEKLSLALKKSYEIELISKSKSYIDKQITIKKFIVDICNLANAA